MRFTRKGKRIIKATNAISRARSSVHWGKRSKHYQGCAGKGGDTTNCEIPEWMFDRELAEYKYGGVVNA